MPPVYVSAAKVETSVQTTAPRQATRRAGQVLVRSRHLLPGPRMFHRTHGKGETGDIRRTPGHAERHRSPGFPGTSSGKLRVTRSLRELTSHQ